MTRDAELQGCRALLRPRLCAERRVADLTAGRNRGPDRRQRGGEVVDPAGDHRACGRSSPGRSPSWANGWTARRRPRSCSKGIAMVPEGRRVFPFMSVKDNLLMGAFTRTRQGRNRRDAGQHPDPLSAPEGTLRPAGQHLVGGRAADDGDRPRADGQAEAVAAGRALAWASRPSWCRTSPAPSWRSAAMKR